VSFFLRIGGAVGLIGCEAEVDKVFAPEAALGVADCCFFTGNAVG
jgi:hypothetical protein